MENTASQNNYDSAWKLLILGVQHVFAMFGATVLVPALTGLNPAVALFTAGVGTLIFHLVTGRKVPVFLGSSFAFIPVILAVSPVKQGTNIPVDPANLSYVTGGIVVAGLVYLLMALLVYLFGVEKVRSFFPPVVTGPVIMVIGLGLSPTAIDMASGNWPVAIIVVASIILVSVFAKGFFKLVPILIGIAAGYVASMLFCIVDYAPIQQASWFELPEFMLPKFSWPAILTIAPIAFVTFMEHIGDITTNSAVVGEDFLKDPGLARTLIGDGLATSFAGLVGGPANTTYSENTGVLAVTKVYNPMVLEIAAIIAILMAFVGKFGAVLKTIPSPVMGGVSLILFGMIASIGMRTISEAHLDFSQSRNLIIVSLILVIGLAGELIAIPVGGQQVQIGLFTAALVGVVLNKILPEGI